MRHTGPSEPNESVLYMMFMCCHCTTPKLETLNIATVGAFLMLSRRVSL